MFLKGCGRNQRREYFLHNGAQLLHELIVSCDGKVNPMRVFSAKELIIATENYSSNRMLYVDFCFNAYLGTHEDRTIVVKRPEARCSLDSLRTSEFLNEVVMLSQINHKHVVKLLGCCLEFQYPIVVYDFFSGVSLNDRIPENSLSGQLSWEDCLRIGTETAEALAYLHLATPKSIVHGNVRTNSIWLDKHCNSKIADFGLSMLIPEGETQVAVNDDARIGTFPYTDPQCKLSGRLTVKTDVYSFGVVLVELLTRWKPIHIVSQCDCTTSTSTSQKLISFVEKKCLELDGETDRRTACAELALRCLQEKGYERPSMKEVCQELQRIKKSCLLPAGLHIVENTWSKGDRVHWHGVNKQHSTLLCMSQMVGSSSILRCC